jgi:hypothetical protein
MEEKPLKKRTPNKYSEFIDSLKVIQVKKKINGFFHGMNPAAAKALGVRYPYGENTIAVIKNDPNKKWLINHESKEYALMKLKGLSYPEAHARMMLLTKDCKTKKEALLDAKENMDWRKQVKKK